MYLFVFYNYTKGCIFILGEGGKVKSDKFFIWARQCCVLQWKSIIVLFVSYIFWSLFTLFETFISFLAVLIILFGIAGTITAVLAILISAYEAVKTKDIIYFAKAFITAFTLGILCFLPASLLIYMIITGRYV